MDYGGFEAKADATGIAGTIDSGGRTVGINPTARLGNMTPGAREDWRGAETAPANGRTGSGDG